MNPSPLPSPHPAFTVVYRKPIPEFSAEAVRYRHTRTGADLLSVRAPDDNKVFAISFRTPPGDSTGVAHILEHCVLAGSRKYPLKEPFKELMKCSLNTFLNAFTYPDKTVYPVASRNLKDFHNLVDVYLDAVFFPRLGEPVFMQEGWHHDVAPDGSLLYRGVVFNEMKGAYSSPDNIAMEAVSTALLPASTYGVDSGGNPEAIPDLTCARFEQFHREHYHPGNSLSFFYGDDPEDRRLEMLDGYFSEFGAPGPLPSIRTQPAFPSPVSVRKRYACASEEDSEGCFVMQAWKLGDSTDLDTVFAWIMLGRLLLDSPAAPLRRALMESGLGEDLTGGGFQTECLHSTFSVGLKGVDAEDAAETEAFILSSLRRIADEGFDPELVEAAFNSLEFSLRENNSGSWPRGLVVLLRILAPWMYGLDPVEIARWETLLTDFRARATADPGLFQRLLRRDLLDNPHRAAITVVPDPAYGDELAGREKQRLSETRASMSPGQIEAVRLQAENLRRMQQEPDPPAALARMPRLSLDDLERKVEILPVEQGLLAGTALLHHPQPTHGIVYLDLAFDLSPLPFHLLPLLPTFARCLQELGTDRHDFSRLASWIGRTTGGLQDCLYTGTHEVTGATVARLILRGKATAARTPDLLEILAEVLSSTQFDQPARVLEFVQEDKSAEESRLVPSGHSIVARRMAAHYTLAESVSEMLDGFEQVRFLRDLVHRCRTDWRGVLRDLEHIRHTLLNRARLLVNITCDPGDFAGVSRRVEAFLSTLPSFPSEPEIWTPFHPPRAECLRGQTQVSYVGRAFNACEYGYREHGSALVAAKWLRNAHLWDRVRVQGGAYGASCSLDLRTGVMAFTSYRDPCVKETLDTFHQSADALRRDAPNGGELDQLIIGVFGSLNPCLLPPAKAYGSMIRSLIGITDEDRQRTRDEVFSTRRADLLGFADILSHLSESDVLAVLCPADKVAEAAAFAKGGKITITDLYE